MVEKLKQINVLVLFLVFFFFFFNKLAFGHDVIVFSFFVIVIKRFKYLQKDFSRLLISKLKDSGISVFSFQDTVNLLREKNVRFLESEVIRNLIMYKNAKYGVYGKLEERFGKLKVDLRIVDKKGYKKFLISQDDGNVDKLISKIAAKIENLFLKREFIAKIDVKGNKILDKDFILMKLNIEPGDLLDFNLINQEVKKLYKTGYFQDIQVIAKDSSEGKILIFKVDT